MEPYPNAGIGFPFAGEGAGMPLVDKKNARKGIPIALIDILVPVVDKTTAQKDIRIARITIHVPMIGKYSVRSSEQSFDTTCPEFIEGLRVTHFKSKFACHSSVDRNPLWITR